MGVLFVVRARFLGITGYLPERLVTNADLARENPDWEMDRIQQRTGIRSRHIAAAGETACDLGYQAARRLLDRQLVPSNQIDYVIVSTQTPDHFVPSNACLLQDRLRLGKHAGAVDFNGGCTGFITGLQLAKSLVLSREARNVLLVTTDTYSKLTHPKDRSARTVFGDGAAATLIAASDEGGEIGAFLVGTDGAGATRLNVPAGAFRISPTAETAREEVDEHGCVRSANHLFMDGQAVFAFVLNTIPQAVAKLLEKAAMSRDDIDWYVFHQSNRFMLENLADCCGIPSEKMVYHLETVGNTVSASVPLALEAWVAQARIRPGQRLMLVSYGAGWSWYLCIATWG